MNDRMMNDKIHYSMQCGNGSFSVSNGISVYIFYGSDGGGSSGSAGDSGINVAVPAAASTDNIN